ncbi:MAG: ABC transporter substrate-binding protein [Promethearchaeota archaeon]
MERNQLIAVVVIVIVVVGAGVAFYFFSQPTRPPEDTLVWETIGNPDYLDPHVDYESYGSSISYNVYETLYTYPFGTAETEPSVPLLAAAAPVWNAAGTAVNITLREGITFQDGTPFNASCVKWNFERAMKIFYPDGPVWMFAEPIMGGTALEDIAFDQGPSSTEFQTAFDAWVAAEDWIDIFDETHFRLNLAEAYVPFISAITYEVGAMMSPTFAITHGTTDNSPVDMSHYGVDYGEYDGYMAEHTCGTGPYMVQEWLPNQWVYLTYNENYWRADSSRTDLTSPVDIRPESYSGSIKNVYLKTNEDVTSRILDVRAGTADGVYLPYTNAGDLLDLQVGGGGGTDRYTDVHVSYGGTSYFVEHFGFNMETVYNFNGQDVNLTSAFADRNLRLAFSYAFNDSAFMLSAVFGFGVQAQGIIPRGMFGHVDDLPMYTTNLTKAGEYWNLAMANATTKANYEAFESHGGLTLYYNSGNTRREQACLILKDSIQKMYGEPGVTQITTDTAGELTVNVQGLEWSNYLDQGRQRAMGIFIIGWIPDYADPDNFVFPYAYARGTFAYRLGYNNTEVNAWYLESRGELNTTRRAELFSDIEYAVYHDVPMRMVLQGGELRCWRTWLLGQGKNWNPMTTSGGDWGYIFDLYKSYPTQ